MISIWSRFASYWQAKGWLWMGIAAVTCLAVCWLISERNNITGTYDRFDFKVKNNPEQFKTQRQYFPQSIAYEDPYKDLYQTKRKVPQNSKGEEICRDTLQRLFQQPFPKCRPDFLFNSVTGENLELDMYNKDYGLAVEYNGQQHYKYNSFMHGGSRDKFYGQQYRDKMKRDICKKLGITLIEVPYTVKHRDIPNFLAQRLRELNFIR
jgi:hypothetical protein